MTCAWTIVLILYLLSTTLALQINQWQEGHGSKNAVIDLQQTPFEEYWNSLPSLQQSSQGNKHLKVDGYSFQGRMAVYRFLINSIDSKDLWSKTSSFREYHWLWAYAAQLDWQHRSKRLNPSCLLQQSDEISSDSWWGYMNFGFSVAILLGWKQTQPDVTIELDSRSQYLIENDKAIKNAFRDGKISFEMGTVNFFKK